MNENKQQLVEDYNISSIFSLIKKGEHPDLFKNKRGFSILGRSIIEEDYSCLCFLLEHGASTSKINLANGDFDPLLETIKRKQNKSALKIIQYSQNLSQKENSKHPVYLAIENKMLDVVSLMLPKLSISFINNKDKPILHFLIQYMIKKREREGMLKYINEKYQFLSSDCLFYLLDRGADPSIKYEGFNAAEIAQKYWSDVLNGSNTSSAAIAVYSLLQHRILTGQDSKGKGETQNQSQRENNKEKSLSTHHIL